LANSFETLSLSGHKVIHYSVTDSTNLRLKALANEDGPNGTCVISDEQTAGRGRMDRKWLSRKGAGAWFSCLVKPDSKTVYACRASDLVFIAALSVNRALKNFSANTLIKWPNDLVLNGKKVCGIMCEMASDEQFLKWAVLGVGVNLTGSEFPSDLPWAASIESETGIKIEPLVFLKAFLEEFDFLIRLWKKEGLSPILSEISKVSATLGREIKAILTDSVISGKAVRFSEDGALIILTETGEKTLVAGDVSVRGIMGYV